MLGKEISPRNMFVTKATHIAKIKHYSLRCLQDANRRAVRIIG